MTPRVIGIDPSMTATGLAWADKLAVVTFTAATDRRLDAIYHAVQDALGYDGAVDLAVVEDLPVHGKGAGITGMAQGVIRLALIRAGVPYVTVPAATLKKFATGRGNATKPDLRVELLKRAGLDERDDNKVDAWWLRAIGMEHLGAPIVDLPKAHVAALGKLKWPVPG